MINVIVSHDVDHLFAKDHWFRDLIYPKLWVRSTIQLIRKDITAKEWWLRNTSCIRRKRHNLDALMEFDQAHGIKSTFFFGMANGLGMSYKPQEAVPVIKIVNENGFPVGVHGIDYTNISNIQREHDLFRNLTGIEPCGIRMHYVRFDKSTFRKLNSAGYTFDCTEFDKINCGTRKNPYRVGKMWEFPLTIMDAYLPQKFNEAQKRTIEILERCKKENINCISVLFHDYQFCCDYMDMKKWYIWLIDYFKDSAEYQFISYNEVICMLEAN